MITEMLSYAFMRRAILVGLMVSLCAALLGVSLVLKRYSMIGDGLSHVGFGALSVALALNLAPMAVSLPVVLVAAVLLLRVSESSSVRGDQAIAMIAAGSLSIGVAVTSLVGGMNVDVASYMFGSILSMSDGDVILSVALSVTVLALFILLYNRIFAVTFDESFARATGTRVSAFNLILALLTAATVVVGMRMMGTLLMSSLIVFPAMTAMRLSKRFRGVVLLSALISVAAFLIGIVFSYALSVPAGASVVCANMLLFFLCYLIGLILRRRRA